MKSRTSPSLDPLASCSRIWFLRSTASGAFDSASVWFWHTRQRSSSASAATRLSRFSAPNAEKLRMQKKNTNLATAQLLHQRPHLPLRHFRRERADVLVADHALAVDDVGFRHAVDAVVDRDAPGGVVHRELVGIAVAGEPRQSVLARVLVVQPDHRHALRELAHHRVLDQARRAPRRPHVEHPHLAEHLLLREGLRRLVEPRQLEGRRRLADERRGHFARIELEADREQYEQRDEAQGQPQLFHAIASAMLFFFSVNRYLRSLAASRPPRAITRQPPQIQSTNGLCCSLISQASPPRGSPSET